MRQQENRSVENGKDDPGKEAQASNQRATDHLANERTFLAWLRTGLAIIGFGFVVTRFGLLLRELRLQNVTPSQFTGSFSENVGVLLVVIGTCLLVLALVDFLRNRRMINENNYYPSVTLMVIVTVLCAIVGASMVVYLLFYG